MVERKTVEGSFESACSDFFFLTKNHFASKFDFFLFPLCLSTFFFFLSFLENRQVEVVFSVRPDKLTDELYIQNKVVR